MSHELLLFDEYYVLASEFVYVLLKSLLAYSRRKTLNFSMSASESDDDENISQSSKSNHPEEFPFKKVSNASASTDLSLCYSPNVSVQNSDDSSPCSAESLPTDDFPNIPKVKNTRRTPRRKSSKRSNTKNRYLNFFTAFKHSILHTPIKDEKLLSRMNVMLKKYVGVKQLKNFWLNQANDSLADLVSKKERRQLYRRFIQLDVYVDSVKSGGYDSENKLFLIKKRDEIVNDIGVTEYE